jgi:hypothetical protein
MRSVREYDFAGLTQRRHLTAFAPPLQVNLDPKERVPMILGMSIELFTRVHVVISLIGIVAGALMLLGLITRRPFPILTATFLATTALTSITGFMFPFKGVTPGIILGVISVIVLLIAVIARYGKHLEGGWRGVYVITAMIALYLNTFVLFVQLFAKVPQLHAVAPNMSSPGFSLTQVALLVLFIAVTFRAYKRFGAA